MMVVVFVIKYKKKYNFRRFSAKKKKKSWTNSVIENWKKNIAYLRKAVHLTVLYHGEEGRRQTRTMASLICLTPIGLNHWCMLINRLGTIFNWCLWPAAAAAAVVGIGYVADRQLPDVWWCCGATAPVVSTVNGVVAAASCTRPTPVARGSGVGFSSTTIAVVTIGGYQVSHTKCTIAGHRP